MSVLADNITISTADINLKLIGTVLLCLLAVVVWLVLLFSAKRTYNDSMLDEQRKRADFHNYVIQFSFIIGLSILAVLIIADYIPVKPVPHDYINNTES